MAGKNIFFELSVSIPNVLMKPNSTLEVFFQQTKCPIVFNSTALSFE